MDNKRLEVIEWCQQKVEADDGVTLGEGEFQQEMGALESFGTHITAQEAKRGHIGS